MLNFHTNLLIQSLHAKLIGFSHIELKYAFLLQLQLNRLREDLNNNIFNILEDFEKRGIMLLEQTDAECLFIVIVRLEVVENVCEPQAFVRRLETAFVRDHYVLNAKLHELIIDVCRESFAEDRVKTPGSFNHVLILDQRVIDYRTFGG